MAGRWLKWIGLTFLAIVVLVAGAVGAALLLIDTEALKSRIEQRVRAETGRELSIDGPVQVSVVPWIGFELGPTRLANASGFGERAFVAFDHAELRARLWPLLQREVVLDTVVLHGVRMNAARNAEGRTNWADLAGADRPAGAQTEAPPDAGGESPPAGAPPDAASPAAGPPLRLRVEGVDLRDARVSWRDAVEDRHLVLEDLDLSTGALESDRPAQVHLSTTLRAEDALALAIEADARVRYDLESRAGAVQALTIDLAAQGPGVPPGTTARIGADLRFDLAAGTATAEPVTLDFMDIVSAEGASHARFAGDTPSFRGRLDVAPFSPAELAEAAGFALPERADTETLQHASLAFDFAGDPTGVRVDPLEATLDDTNVSGLAHAQLADPPTVSLDLSADQIELDRYLPPEEADGDGNSEGEGEGKGASDGDPIANLPTEALHGFGGHARLSVGQVQWRELEMSDLQLEGQLADGVLDVTRADVGIAGGRLSATGQLDASDPATPAARSQTELTDVQSQPLLASFADTAPVTGRLTAQAQLAAAGGNLEAWTRALDGELGAIFRDGAIQGINIAQRLRMAAARISGDELTQADETRSTDFSSLQISATIADGVLRSDDLDLRAPLLRVGGEGSVNLPERSLDYTARVVVTGTLEGQGGETGPNLRGVEVPLQLSGPLASPEIDLLLAEVLRERVEQEARQGAEEAEERAREEIEEEVDEAGDRIERELREGLEGLFE